MVITRRRAIVTGFASLGAIVLAKYPKQLPPTYGSLLRMGDNLTYAAQRALLPGQSLVKEYTLADITPFPAVGTVKLPPNVVSDWKLTVEGRVAKPQTFSIADLKRLPSRTQITRHTCEEGWTAIGQWTGVPLATLLDSVGMMPSARFIVFHTYDDGIDSIDMLDALHPQTILAYGMNGGDVPVQHGAPLRLRVEQQMGYKSVKFVQRIVVSDEFDDGGKKGPWQNGWAWYTGI